MNCYVRLIRISAKIVLLAATNLVEGIGEESMNTIMSTRRYHQKGAYLTSNTVGVEYKRTPVAFVHFMIKFREGMRAERMTMTRLSITLNTIMITYHVIYTYYDLIIPLQLKDALQMFQGIVGSSFSYIHCLWMLHHEKNGMIGLHPSPRRTRKQQSQQAQLNRAWKQKKRGQASVWPMGRDKAKRQWSQGGISSSSTACLEVLQKISMDRSAYEERQEEHSKELLSHANRKLASQERLAATQEFEQEQRIMSIDVGKVVSWQRDYYLRLQQQII
jgi:hypothetical protein